MRLRLDTHIAIWAIIDAPALSAKARKMITDPGNEVFVSLVTLWETAIKHPAARRRGASFPMASEPATTAFRASGYTILNITPAHIHTVASLPPIHNDPFDRLLIAQAKEIPLRLLTHDGIIARMATTS